MIGREVLTSSSSEDWPTPKPWFGMARETWGCGLTDGLALERVFDLDPCATKRTAKASTYFSRRQNGLKQPWFGYVFCNPPFNRSKKLYVDPWIKKGWKEVRDGKAIRVVMLLPARTDTKWFHEFVFPYAAEVCFVKGRINFVGGDAGAPFPSMVAVFDTRLRPEGVWNQPMFTTMRNRPDLS